MNKTAVEIIGLARCTGCSACAAVCPTASIQMVESKFGFLEPRFFTSCSKCATCTKVCPVIHEQILNNCDPIGTYGAWSNSSENLLKSSSGGLFSELARVVLDIGGNVIGSILQGHRPYHIVSKNFQDVEKMRGSKYIQSITSQLFLDLAAFPAEELYLFSGTPCQVAAMKNLWTFFSYPTRNLLTCDLVCHGVPSYLLFDRYIERMSRRRKIDSVNFRDKSLGWRKFSMKIIYTDGDIAIIPHKKDRFMRTFLSDICLRECCYACTFNRIPRVADITLGDFWGAPSQVENNMGTSAIIVNSEKGAQVFDKLLDKGQITVIDVNLQLLSFRNRRIYSGQTTIPQERTMFMKTLVTGNLSRAYRRFVIPIRLRNIKRAGLNLIQQQVRNFRGTNV